MIKLVIHRAALLVMAGMISANIAVVAVPKKFREQATHSASDELALIREISAVKEKLEEYTQSQSFIDSVTNAAMVSCIGGGIGALAGVVHMILSKSLFDDYACLVPHSDDRNMILASAQAIRIAAFALQGCISGFLLGVAGRAGSLPQMSKTKLALILALQNVIAVGLSIGADHVGMNALESTVEDTVRKGAMGEVGVDLARAAGRRAMFTTTAAGFVGLDGPLLDKELLTSMPVFPTLIAQVIVLFFVAPEAFEVRSSRNKENKQMLALRNALNKLEQSLNCVEAEDSKA